MAMGFAIIIPARFASKRYPGKPLVKLRGASGVARSLIERSWRVGAGIAGADRTWVATDDERIAAEVNRFGGQVVMTPSSCRNGTERCARALALGGIDAPIVVNLQGDAPLTPPGAVARLVDALTADSEAVMATPAVPCSASVYEHLLGDQAAGRVGGTTAVFDRDHRALYFSKRVIPHTPDPSSGHQLTFLHLGVYAYRPQGLADYAALDPTPLEQAEGLEQLRFLESGAKVRVVPIEQPEWDCIELNNPQDVTAIEAIMARHGIE